MSVTPLPFVHRRRVRWAEVDVAGAVDLGTLTRYSMEALEEWFLDRLGLDWSELHVGQKLATPFVRAELNFRRPVRSSEFLKVAVSVEKLGRSSVIFQVVGRSETDDGCCWDARFSCVFADAETLQSIAVPKAYRDVIERDAGPKAE
jgi:4-hydroxybenzoyl-CoA thioesterase